VRRDAGASPGERFVGGHGACGAVVQPRDPSRDLSRPGLVRPIVRPAGEALGQAKGDPSPFFFGQFQGFFEDDISRAHVGNHTLQTPRPIVCAAAPSKRRRIRTPAEVSRHMVVALVGARCGVGHGEDVVDVGRGAVEEPDFAVEGGAVDHLDRQIEVGRVHEPEGSLGVALRHGLSVSCPEAVDAPGDVDGVASLEQAECGGSRNAGGGAVGGWGGEGVEVGGSAELSAVFVVEAHAAGCGVGGAQPELDVGEDAVEEPEVAVDGAAVQHLDQQLGIGVIEEPQLAGGLRVGSCSRGAGEAVAVLVPPARFDAEPSAVEAEPVRACGAGCAWDVEAPGAITPAGERHVRRGHLPGHGVGAASIGGHEGRFRRQVDARAQDGLAGEGFAGGIKEGGVDPSGLSGRFGEVAPDDEEISARVGGHARPAEIGGVRRVDRALVDLERGAHGVAEAVETPGTERGDGSLRHPPDGGEASAGKHGERRIDSGRGGTFIDPGFRCQRLPRGSEGSRENA